MKTKGEEQEQTHREAIFICFKELEKSNEKFEVDADLVFIPILSDHNDHFSLVCVNLISKQLEYLDNRSYEDPILDTCYGLSAQNIVSLLTVSLCHSFIDFPVL